MSIMTAVATTNYLAVCTTCVRPTRQTITDGGQYAWLTCPQCNTEIRGERIHATLTYGLCHPDCMSAVGPSCSCSCGGKNHGGAYAEAGEMLESAVNAYRERVAKLEAKRAARAASENRRKRTAFDDWAADHADVLTYLDGDVDWSDFLRDLRDQVERLRPLSERQVAAVRRMIDRKRQRDAERAARAERLAANPAAAAPLGRQDLEGEIVSWKQDDNPYTGALVHKLTVDCGGFRVYMTMPRSIAPSSFTAIEWAEFLKALPGSRIAFTATLEPSRGGDPSFVYGKRPTKARLLAAQAV